MLSFTLRPLCPWGYIPRDPLDRTLWGLQSRSDHSGEEANVWLLPGGEPRLLGRCPSSSHITGRAIVIATNYPRPIFTPHQLLFGWSNKRRGWAGHVARTVNRRDAYRVLVSKPEGTEPSGRPRSRCKDNSKIIFKKWRVKAWTRLIWLRIGTGGGLLWMR